MLKRFFRWLWRPGPCRFEVMHEVRLFDGAGDKMPCGRKYVCRCTTCGAIRVTRV
jgi:hypothetical protein